MIYKIYGKKVHKGLRMDMILRLDSKEVAAWTDPDYKDSVYLQTLQVSKLQYDYIKERGLCWKSMLPTSLKLL